jgi:hypothetical protein
MEVEFFTYRVYKLSSSGTVLCNEGQKIIHPLTIGQKERSLSESPLKKDRQCVVKLHGERVAGEEESQPFHTWCA